MKEKISFGSDGSSRERVNNESEISGSESGTDGESLTILHHGSELTDTQADIVEYLARNPNATNRDIADAVG